MTASTSEPAAIAWVESEVVRHHGKAVELPSSTNVSLCEFLRDGRALCRLVAALSDELANDSSHDANNANDLLAIPKKIDKSMHQLSTFHALERIHFFIRWCRQAAKLEEHLVFTSVQLLDEQNADAVLACIDALRTRFRPTVPVKTETPTPVEVTNNNDHDHDDEGEEEDNNLPERDEADEADTASLSSASSATATATATTNKLSAFLTKVPSAPPTAPSASAPQPATTTERASASSSLSQRLSGASLTGSSSSATPSRRASSNASLTSSERAADDDANDSARSSRTRSGSGAGVASPRGGSISKLKLPGAFATLATVLPHAHEQEDEEEEEAVVVVADVSELDVPEVASTTPNRDVVDHSDDMIKHVSKLEIPPVFGRSTSLEDVAAVKIDSVKRSVSKLRIPAAFSGAGSDAGASTPVEEEQEVAPVVPEEPVSNSPKSKLAAFAKTVAPTPTAEPTPVVEEAKPSKKKSTGKLKIPGVFGKAVGAAAPVPKKKPVTKLSAFLSTVENEVPPPIEAKPERKFAFPIPGTAEAKKPVQKPVAKKAVSAAAPAKKIAAFAAFMQKVPVSAPTPAARVERDTVPAESVEEVVKPAEKIEEVVAEEVSSVVAPVVSVESPAATVEHKPSALLAFMKKVVVTPPTPAARVERDGAAADTDDSVKAVEEEPLEVVEPAAVEEEKEQEQEQQATESIAPAAPSPPKSNKLLAFLAAVESPVGSASEEEEGGDEEEAATVVAAPLVSTTSHVEVDDEDDHKKEEEEQEEQEEQEEEERETVVAAEMLAVAPSGVIVETGNEVDEAAATIGEAVQAVITPETVVVPVDTEAEPVAVPVEAEATVEPSVEAAPTSAPVVVEDDHEDECASPVVESFPDHDVIVEVSGELTHEAIMRRRLSSVESLKPRRARSRSPVRSPKSSAARKLFGDDEEDNSQTIPTEVTEAPAVVEADIEIEPSVSLTAFQTLEQAKQAVDAENEQLQQQLTSVKGVVKTQKDALDALEAELAALRQQLEGQTSEAAASQENAIALVRRELEEASARRESEHRAALEVAQTRAREEASAALHAQLTASESLAAERLEQLTALQRAFDDQQLVLTQSKESEEAARYAAQMAFAARDEAEDASVALQEKLNDLTRAVGSAAA